jgi:hypothetical protein
VSERDSYAVYVLKRRRGTRLEHGSSAGESNHLSVLNHLNVGIWNVNIYCENPHTLIKDLFQRQQVHINKFKVRLLEKNK